jgi:hypothetical protein
MQLNPSQQKQYDHLLNLLNRVPKSEQQLQSKCAELLYFFYPAHWKRLVTTFNNSLRANTQGFGIVPGASDMYWLAWADVKFIEFKFGTNRQSPAQIEWQAICEDLEHEYHLCYIEADFWRIIGFNQPCEADILNLDWFK